MLTADIPHPADRRAMPWPARRICSVFLLAVIATVWYPATATAHAALESSEPAGGDIVPASPPFVTVRFTEPLERSYSRMVLHDSAGNPVAGTTLSEGDDAFTMRLALPANLGNGTYSILWRTLSAADGHTAQNYFAFTIGSNADIASVVIPGAASAESTAPQWARTLSRWAALVGLALLLAAWPVWSVVVRPALGGVWRSGPGFVRRMKRYVAIATFLAIGGSLAALVVQSFAIADGSPFDKVLNTLGQTRYGRLWLARIALIVISALVLAACGWWFVRRREAEGVAAWIVAAALPIPFSLIAHAAAQRNGRLFAVAADSVHLFAASLWIGGLAILAFVLLPGLRGLEPLQRRHVLAIAIPRFSVLALISMASIGITGFYAGWLHVGNLTALRTTDYGKTLIVKLAVLAAILGIAAVNLLIIERRLTRSAANDPVPFWSGRLRWTIGGELALVAVLLLAVGQMTSMQPARDVVAERARQMAVPLVGESTSPTLLLAPGVAGLNHFRLQVPDAGIAPDTEALLRLTIPDRPDLGTKEIPLARVSGNAFEHHGSELSIAGTWRVTAIVRNPGESQLQADGNVTIGTTAHTLDVPGDPWRFRTTGGVTGLVLILLGLAGGVLALFAQSRRSRQESGGLGFAALLLGIVLLVQSRIDPALANATGESAIDPGDVAMVTRGEEVYTAMCLSCHGADLRGDGPASVGMEPPPADFSQQHTMVHTEEDLLYWLRNGIQGSAMPAFEDTLSDQEMLDVLSFIRYRQQRFMEATPAPPTTATPGAPGAPGVSGVSGPAGCGVVPRTMDEIAALAGKGDPAPAGAPLQVTGATLDDVTRGAIQETSALLVSCTNALDTMGRLALFSDAYLAASFAAGVPADFAATATDAAGPLPVEQRLVLTAVQDAAPLTDGRVAATVAIDDPAGQFRPGTGAPPGTTPEIGTSVRAQLILVRSGDRWLIDEIRPL